MVKVTASGTVPHMGYIAAINGPFLSQSKLWTVDGISVKLFSVAEHHGKVFHAQLSGSETKGQGQTLIQGPDLGTQVTCKDKSYCSLSH